MRVRIGAFVAMFALVVPLAASADTLVDEDTLLDAGFAVGVYAADVVDAEIQYALDRGMLSDGTICAIQAGFAFVGEAGPSTAYSLVTGAVECAPTSVGRTVRVRLQNYTRKNGWSTHASHYETFHLGSGTGIQVYPVDFLFNHPLNDPILNRVHRAKVCIENLCRITAAVFAWSGNQVYQQASQHGSGGD